MGEDGNIKSGLCALTVCTNEAKKTAYALILLGE